MVLQRNMQIALYLEVNWKPVVNAASQEVSMATVSTQKNPEGFGQSPYKPEVKRGVGTERKFPSQPHLSSPEEGMVTGAAGQGDSMRWISMVRIYHRALPPLLAP